MKIGILGCSSIAKRCVIPAIKKVKDLTLYGVASRDINKAIDWGFEYYTNPYTYDELLKSDVDIIYVSLPPALHYEWGKKVLLSGKHLLMEKTFTTSTIEAVELFNIAKQKGLKCMEALMYEFHPVHNKIDELLKDMGDVKHIDATFCFPYFANENDIRYSKKLGGGSIHDSLIYPLSFVYRILGDTPEGHTFTCIESEVIERGTICFTYMDSIANINFGFGQAYRNEITISCEDEVLKLQRAFSRTPECTNPIQIIKNGNVKNIEIEKADHFENMIKYFISEDCLELKRNNTCRRLKFMDEIK
tara:strand:- start:6542 stop:7453 length:912 start_codon:yes stop_codon:yes gene_type:complete